jgi:hypothetical protein
MNRDEMLSSSSEKPPYVAPTITTLTENDVLGEVGPAQAYTGNIPFAF